MFIFSSSLNYCNSKQKKLFLSKLWCLSPNSSNSFVCCAQQKNDLFLFIFCIWSYFSFKYFFVPREIKEEKKCNSIKKKKTYLYRETIRKYLNKKKILCLHAEKYVSARNLAVSSPWYRYRVLTLIAIFKLKSQSGTNSFDREERQWERETREKNKKIM